MIFKMDNNKIVMTITNKNVIKLMRLLKHGKQIKKKEVKNKFYACFFNDVKKDILNLELQIVIILAKLNIEIDESIQSILQYERKLDVSHHIDLILKNPNHTFIIHNDEFATLTFDI